MAEPADDNSDAYALARALASEAGGSYTDEERKAVAWAIRNRAAVRRKSVRELAQGKAGAWGRQGTGGRIFSTRQPPTEADVALARQVLAQAKDQDPVRGAYTFHEPSQYGSEKRAAEVRSKWEADGERVLATVGRWEFLGRGGRRAR